LKHPFFSHCGVKFTIEVHKWIAGGSLSGKRAIYHAGFANLGSVCKKNKKKQKKKKKNYLVLKIRARDHIILPQFYRRAYCNAQRPRNLVIVPVTPTHY